MNSSMPIQLLTGKLMPGTILVMCIIVLTQTVYAHVIDSIIHYTDSMLCFTARMNAWAVPASLKLDIHYGNSSTYMYVSSHVH